MRGSLRIGRIAGIPLSVHWSFSLLLLLVFLASAGETASKAAWLLVWVVALFASVTLHELTHCAVARRKGLVVKGIVLLPIGGVSQISGFPGPPSTEAEVAIAGPLASLVIAGLAAAVAVALGFSLWPPTLLGRSWPARLAWLNLLLAAFNMLPALPMDGGRVFRAMLARRRGQAAATRTAAMVAEVLAAAMVVLGFFVNIWLIPIGLFVFLGAGVERRFALLAESLEGWKVADVMVPDPTTVEAATPVGELRRWAGLYTGRFLPVVAEGRVVGIVSLVDLARREDSASVRAVCDSEVPVLDADQPLGSALLEVLGETRREAYPVTGQGTVRGVLYRRSIEQLIGRLDRSRREGDRAA